MFRRELIFFAALTLSLPAAARQVSDQPGEFKFVARPTTGALFIDPIDRLADFGGVKTNDADAFKVALFKWRGGATRFNSRRFSSPRFNFRDGGRSFNRFSSARHYSTPLAHSRGLSAAPQAGHSSFPAVTPPTQFRSPSVASNPAILQNHATKAETDLIGRLHTLQSSGTAVGQPTISASITQTQIKAPPSNVPLNPSVVQARAATAESALLRALQPPTVAAPSNPPPSPVQAQVLGAPQIQKMSSGISSVMTSSGKVVVSKNGQILGSDTPHQPTQAELALVTSKLSKQYSGPTISQIIASAPTPQAQLGTPKPNVPFNLSAIQAQAAATETALLKALQPPGVATPSNPPSSPVLKVQTPVLGTPQAQPTLSSYSFTTTPYGTVQVSKNGQIIGTGTPEYAAQYGYKPSEAPTAQNSVVASQIGSKTGTTGIGAGALPQTKQAISTSISKMQVVALQPNAPINQKNFMQNQTTAADASLLQALQAPKVTTQPNSVQMAPVQVPGSSSTQIAQPAGANPGSGTPFGPLNQFYNSPLGKTLVATLSGAGAEVPVPGSAGVALKILGLSANRANLFLLAQQKDYLGIATSLTSTALNLGGSFAAAYAAPTAIAVPPAVLIGGVAAGSVAFGQYFVAPLVAPSIGTALFNKYPSVFTPPSQISQPIQVDPFTQKPIMPSSK